MPDDRTRDTATATGVERTLCLGQVSVRELSRAPGRVLERVRRGERLIVVRHKKPLATLQPLDGYVGQPLVKRESKVDGSPLGNVADEVDGMTRTEGDLLIAVRLHKLCPARVDAQPGDVTRALRSMEIRGLVRRSPIGWVLRGRGMMLREVLLARMGRQEEDTWRMPQFVPDRRRWL